MTIAKPEKYDSVAMILHWVIASLLIAMLIFGENMMDAEEGAAWLPSLHVSIGFTVLTLSLVRLGWRLANPPPPLPSTMAPWEKLASHASHALFYLLMIGLPVSGWLALPALLREEAKLVGITAFGLGMPAAPDLGLPMGDLHGVIGNVAWALLALHVLAALKHQFVNRDGVLKRMLP
jgi:cytochrome b561